jgi:phytoene synthase
MHVHNQGMDIKAAFAACEAAVRKHDPDRYLSTLFAPAEKRPFLFTLYAFNHEIGRIGETVREPMMGEIRLQWWRDTVEDARDGRPRAHDVAHALAGMFVQKDLPLGLFGAMMAARAFDVSPGTFPDVAMRDAYLDATSGNVMRLAARILGAGAPHDDLAREAGIAYGLAGLIRSQPFHAARNKSFLQDASAARADARERLARARRLTVPRQALAAFLPAALVPLYLRRSMKDLPLYRKQLAMLSASLRGRV